MAKILTVCRHGLVSSVALADVLKMHFEPVDVIPIGITPTANGDDTRWLLASWADFIIVMEEGHAHLLPINFKDKILHCDIGLDDNQDPKDWRLIGKVFTWVREHAEELGIKEHQANL